MNPFEKLLLEIKRLEIGYREESFYRALCDFLEEYASGKEFLHMPNVRATNNPSSESVGEGVGFPDIEVRQNRRLIGYIEVKPPNLNLDNPSFSVQFNRYKESLENIIITNFKKWILYTWDKDGKPLKTAEAEWDESDLETKELKRLLTVFFEGQSYQAKTPHQLALALARKTKLLSNQVEEAITKETPEKRLMDLKNTFEKTLIQDISNHQFANIFAETITYSLFLAMLQHFEKGSNEEFTLRTAVDYLPKSVPIFRDLYQLTGGIVEPITPEIHNATKILIEQLNFADIEKIYKKLVEHKPGEDPVIQFYEPFLAEYDPKEREARGVYYTPKPVVDYIVRSVDHILKTKFNKLKGFGDESVQVLDPAVGTGTFLMSVIQNIYADIEKENKPLGEDLVKRKFNEVVSNHILKHLYGFELLVAPYAIAHLKLTLELERLGFNFSMTEDDSDSENDRLKIFLANTLDDPEKPPINLFGFESVTEESEKARLVKKDAPILVITGNPPYSAESSNKGVWIEDLMTSYKKTLLERNIKPLSDDYIKFIRFAQWKLAQSGQGIFAMITNNSFIDGVVHRQMRCSLIETFDDIYIYNLHGDGRRGEITPQGTKDENVFNIQQGVSINIFVKYPQKKKETTVYYQDLFGLRELKFSKLLDGNFQNEHWMAMLPRKPYFYFVPSDTKREDEYAKFLSITDVYLKYSTGIQTQNDDLVIKFEEESIDHLVKDFSNLNSEELTRKYSIKNDTEGWILGKAIKDAQTNKGEPLLIDYRPFDTRYTYFTGKSGGLMARPRNEIMQHMLTNNLALIFTRLNRQASNGYFGVSSNLVDRHFLDIAKDSMLIAPLYVYEHSSSQLSLLGVGGGTRSSVNISPEFIKEFSGKLGLEFGGSGQGDLEKTFGPEDIFYYAYAIFHSPTYRTRYAEQLKIDFPRLPLTSNKELFKKLVEKGNELVNLHLLGENPFDNSGTIFDDTSKWNVTTAGEKPDGMEDWKVSEVRYDEKAKRVYVNPKQYFEGIEKEVWEFMIGGYQVLEKWLKDRKKAERVLSPDDQIHYMKITVSLRETNRIMKEIDQAIPKWPIT